MKTYVVGTHKKHLNEALLMSTYNICGFSWTNKKNINIFLVEKSTLSTMINPHIFENKSNDKLDFFFIFVQPLPY